MKKTILKYLRLLLLPFSFIYGLVLGFRNFFFNVKVLKAKTVDAFVISVGNLSAGGTGKTPHVNYIAEYLLDKYSIAILLRGYGRQSKGFILVGENATAETVGDEAMLYKKHFGKKLQIAVSESRIKGAEKLLALKNKPSVILLDDAYQHRYINRNINILLMDFNKPFWKDLVLPAGDLREFHLGRKRADIIIITKCPEDLTENVKKQFIKKVKPLASQQVFFSKIVYGNMLPFHGGEFQLPDIIVLVTGIANSNPLVERCQKFSKVKHLEFNDHYDYKVEDIKRIHQIFDKFAEDNKIILTTEKDFVRLKSAGLFQLTKSRPWFYQCMSVEIDEEETFKRIINERIEKF